MVDEMALEASWRPEIKRLVDGHHDTAFAASLDVRRQLGRKFDPERYMDELFDRIVARARQEGRPRMADQLDRERRTFSLGTIEE